VSDGWRVKLYRGSYYGVRAVNGKTERFSLRTKDLGEARRALTDQLAAPVGETVEALVDAYLTDKDKTAVRAIDLRYAWKAAKPHFAHLRPDQVTREVCRSYVKLRTVAGRKPATIRKELETVRAAVNFHKAPGAVFELPRQPPANQRFLTQDEARRLVRAARRFPHIRAFIVLSLTTAARQSALLELTWDRVDFERGIVTLAMGDSGDEARKPRATVPMNRRARRYLKVLRAAATCPHVIEWGGHRVLSIKKGFAAAVKLAKIKGVVPHTLRHTAASWMAQRGVPMFEISKYMGHSDTRITERRYAHLSPDYLRGASKVLDW
jgi:integrase